MIGRLFQRGTQSLHSRFTHFLGRVRPYQCCEARNCSVSGAPPSAATWSGSSQTGGPKAWPSRQPPNPTIIRNVTNILLQQGWSSRTVEQLRELQLKLNPYVVVMVLKRVNHPVVASNFFEWARQEGCCIHDRFSYTAMMKIMGHAKMADRVKLLMDEMRRAGYKLDTVAATTVIGSYARAGLVEEARDLFCNLVEHGCQPDSVTFSVMITMYSKHNLPQEAIKTFRQMLESGNEPDTTSYNTALYALGKMGQVKETLDLWDDMSAKGIRPDRWSYGILMGIYEKAGQPEICWQMYREMRESGFHLNEVIRETVMKALEKTVDTDAAEELCADSEKAGLQIDLMCFYTVIRMWAEAGKPEKAREWWNRMIAAGVTPTFETTQALVPVYLRRRMFEDAKQLLQLVPQWDSTSALRTSTLILQCWTDWEKHEQKSVRDLIKLTGNSVDKLFCNLLDTSLDLAYVSGWVARFFLGLDVRRRVRERFADELINWLFKVGLRQQATSVWVHVFPDQVFADPETGVFTMSLQNLRVGTTLVGLTKILISFLRAYGNRGPVPDWVQISTGPAVDALSSKGESSSSVIGVKDMLASLGSPFSMDVKTQGGFVARGKAVLHWLEDPEVLDILTHHAI